MQCRKSIRIKKKNGMRKSQSGGAFAVFAEYIINNHGIVYGATLSGKEVFYKRIDSVENLDELKGSKYVQAKLMNTFEEAGTWIIGKLLRVGWW